MAVKFLPGSPNRNKIINHLWKGKGFALSWA